MKVLGFNVNRIKLDNSLYDGLRGGRFFNVGAGSFSHPYWTNLDHATEHYKGAQAQFIEHDLMSLKPFPVESGVGDAVYFSHVLEHVSDEAALKAVAEAYRVLKPGGVVRITGPNILLYWDAWNRRDRSFWYALESYRRAGYLTGERITFPQLFLFEFATQLSTLSRMPWRKIGDRAIEAEFAAGPTDAAFIHFTEMCRYSEDYSGYHVNWWSPAKASEVLWDAGFSEVYTSAYGQSRCPPMREVTLFDNTHPKVSFYVEAVK